MFPIRGECSGEGNRAFIKIFYPWNEKMKKFKAVIFDMDGTLLDSMYIWHHLAESYLVKNNIPIPEDLSDKLVIMSIKNAVKMLINDFKLDLTPEEMLEELQNVLADFYRTKADFKPGAREFLQKLRDNGIATMVFSATPQHLIHLALNRLDAENYFSHGLLSCDTVQCGKHQEEAFFKAAAHFGFSPDEIMIFEDAHYAATTAKRAGFTLGIVADQWERRSHELRELADFYIEKSFDEFPIDTFF